MHIYIKIPLEITLFCAVFIFMHRFYKNICFVLFYCFVEGKGARAMGYMWKPEDNFQEPVLSFCQVGSGKSSVDIRLVSKCVYLTFPISHFLLFVPLGVYLLGIVCLLACCVFQQKLSLCNSQYMTRCLLQCLYEAEEKEEGVMGGIFALVRLSHFMSRL